MWHCRPRQQYANNTWLVKWKMTGPRTNQNAWHKNIFNNWYISNGFRNLTMHLNNKQNFTMDRRKNSPIRGWGGLSKMSKKMSIIELSRIGQDLFDFSDLTWGHPLTHSSTHRYLQTKSNYINNFKLYYISHLTWPHPLTHPLIHTPIHRCGCLNKS